MRVATVSTKWFELFMPVKRALLLAALFVATPVSAEISDEVKATCMDAKDFVGCVQALSGGVDIKPSDNIDPLRDAMKQVAARLSSGTSCVIQRLRFNQ